MSSELSVKDIQNTTFDNITSESSKNLDVKESNVLSFLSPKMKNFPYLTRSSPVSFHGTST